MFKDYFYSDKYDHTIVLEKSGQEITLAQLKEYIKSVDFEGQTNILLSGDDGFEFIVKFFAAVLAKKEIFLSDRKDFHIESKPSDNEAYINFFTSGSTSKPKIIRKSFRNLLNEQKDLYEKFKDLLNKNTKFVSTSPMSHMFGMTFQLMFPFFSGHTISCGRILYPEELIGKSNYTLISTPSFLEKTLDCNINPDLIISAGAKLNDKVFEKFSNIIEIYGSTETGVIAYRKTPSNFIKFENVELNPAPDGVSVKSDYFLEDNIILNDAIEIVNENEFKLKNRTDRMEKINEKRVSLCELEKILSENKFIENSVCLKHNEKLCCAIVLNNDGKNFLKNNGRYEIIKIFKNFMAEKSEFIPKKWRFLDEIPKNTRGKIDFENLKFLFDLKLTLPLIMNKKITENSAEIDLIFLKNSNFFNGHFDGFEIVAGVVQLFFAQYFIENIFNIKLSKDKIKKMKFSNPILPDKLLTLKLTRNEDNFEYKYISDEKIYSSGVFTRLI